MKSAYQAINKTCIGFMLSGCLATPVYADDIEIYTDANLVGPLAQPNIMFIMDSSANMATTLSASLPYVYTTTYTDAGYDPDKIYYTDDGTIPATNGDNFTWAANNCQHSLQEYVPVSYTYINTDPDPDETVTVSAGWQGANTGSLYTTGMYSGQLAQLLTQGGSTSWDSLKKNDATSKVECIQDHGLHGEKNTSAINYIIHTSGGWTNDVNLSVADVVWANNANNYVLFAGNYLNYLASPPAAATDPTLFEQLKGAISDLVASASNVNIGLMQYDRNHDDTEGSEGGSVQYPVRDVNLGRNDFYSRLKTMNTGTDPVIAETYFEALKYFGGKAIYFGDSALPSTNGAAKETGNAAYYETPITETCQKSYIVVVSNGLSRYDYIDQSERDSIPGFDSGSCNTGTYAGVDSNYYDMNNLATSSEDSTIDNCLDEMAGWALNNDVAERAFDAHEGDQNITTYTVGFAFPTTVSDELAAGEQLLRDTATKGGGRFIEAANEADLVVVLNQLVSEILKVNSTFSSPAVSVNAFNRATNLEDLYFTLFKPTQGEHWEGNLKKFKLKFNAGDPFVADVNDNPAIDTATGFFKDASVSYWTDAADSPDGAETAKGGAAGEIVLARNTYTFTDTYTGTSGVLTPSATGKVLKSTANDLDDSNDLITNTMLGDVAGYPAVVVDGVDVAYKDALLRWSSGEDIKDIDGDSVFAEVRREMGDPLHAEPALVQYGVTDTGDPDLVAYVATNDGYLHAFDSLTGEEHFAFVPQEMLPKLQNIFDDTGATGKAYGLDGNVIAWINDVNRDGDVADASEHVYLYFGMRRGGRYMYSMDVTDRHNPTLRWVLEGGTGDYAEMGQTWSAPNVEKIKINGAEKTVLIFGAGYDTGQDVLTTRGVDSMGRGIFIVDADTGALLWRAGPTAVSPDPAPNLTLANMVYSIPARITPIDVDGDGYTDRLYAGDMGGQLWRIDINNADVDNTSVSATGGRIANLAIDSSTTENRRFYNSPDVAVILEEGKAPYISIVAASGYRAHPLQTATHDRAYMIRDNNVYDVPDTYTTLTEADLYDTTANLIGEGSAQQVIDAKATLNSKQGWYFTFSEMDGTFVGEKALSEPLILDGVAVFTTFIPASAGLTSNSCKANDGTGAIYFVNVVDGTPTDDNSEDGNVTRVDRRILLARGGIPPTPRVIITSDGIPTLCVGTECSKAGEVGTTQKMYWYEVAQ